MQKQGGDNSKGVSDQMHTLLKKKADCSAVDYLAEVKANREDVEVTMKWMENL